jgi:phosphatidate cytidylyltransferase
MEAALRNRLTLGPVMLLFLLAVLWVDHASQAWTTSAALPYGVKGIGITALLLLLVPLAIRELATLFTAEHVRPFRAIAVLGSSLLLLHAFATQFDRFKPIAASSLATIIVSVMLLTALQRAFVKQTQDAIVHMAGTVLAVMYLGGLCWFLIALRVKSGTTLFGHPFQGATAHVVMILLCVKSTDIGAFFTGRAIGRHKLIFWLSPGKTWEGLAGGLALAAIVGAACAPYVVGLEWYKGALFGALIGGVGQLGDLLESMMKRDAEVKDSGSLVPGFGGILDIMDSPLLAAPFAYLLFSLF